MAPALLKSGRFPIHINILPYFQGFVRKSLKILSFGLEKKFGAKQAKRDKCFFLTSPLRVKESYAS